MTVTTASLSRSPAHSRLRARLVLAGLSAFGLAALAWASFKHPLPRLTYNPSDSVAVGWYRVDPLDRRTSSPLRDRKSTRLNSSHLVISYAGLCLKKKEAFPHERGLRRRARRKWRHQAFRRKESCRAARGPRHRDDARRGAPHRYRGRHRL